LYSWAQGATDLIALLAISKAKEGGESKCELFRLFGRPAENLLGGGAAEGRLF